MAVLWFGGDYTIEDNPDSEQYSRDPEMRELQMAPDYHALARQLGAALASSPSSIGGVGELYGRYVSWFVGDRKHALDAARKMGVIE